MLNRRSWLCLTLLLLVGSIQPVTIDARMVVGVSTVNVAFLPIYVTQDKGFFKTRAWTFSLSCSMPERPIFRR